MSLFKQFATDSKKEIDGIEVKFYEAENDDGSIPTFIVSRMGKSNKRYAKALEQATRPHRRQIALETFSNEKGEEIILNVFAETVVIGWSNVLDRNGIVIEYSKENAVKLLTELPELYARLQEEASLVVNFRNEMLEEEAKN